ncbi:MAG: BON domain-containing protein [Bryobacterales bacterium]|nr:BON domain-containing protein [Bryobacteraceae bacterium]MDW8355771.1 BON domain-containing protein [Bryobacterales bacterium]
MRRAGRLCASALLCVYLCGADKRTPVPRSALTDAQLEAAIRERFAKSKVAEDGFTVRVQGGVATIEGRTDVVQRKGAATRMAKSAGAKKVVNKVVVSDAARLKASNNLTTGRRRAQVRRGQPRSESGSSR